MQHVVGDEVDRFFVFYVRLYVFRGSLNLHAADMTVTARL